MRGGFVENVNVLGLNVGTVIDLIVINFYYEEGEDGPFMPEVRNINIQNVRCLSARRVLDLRGFADAPILDVNLSGIVVQRASMPSRVFHVEGLNFSQVTVNGRPVRRASDLSSLSL
jgi:hypothetical protein